MTPPAPGERRSASRYAAVLALLVLAVLLGTAAPASAHATLLFTGPAADATVADAPSALVLVFDQPVSLSGATTVRLKPSADLGSASLSNDGRTVTLPVRGGITAGVRTVEWQVTARDGDIMAGSYQFAVGPRTVALNSGQATQAKDATPTAVLRWLLFAALALLLGELTGRRLATRVPGAPGARPRRWAPAAALVGSASAVGLAALLAHDGSSLGTRPGVLALSEVAGFALAALATFLRRESWAALPLTGVVVAEALRAHPQADHPLAGALLTAIHLTGAVLWTGTLVNVLRTAALWRGAPARTVLLSYARLAAWLFAAVIISGLVSALLLVPFGDFATTGYGQVLLVKIALVAAVSGLAVLARRRLRARTGRSAQRLARTEAAILACVLALAATLTVLPAPAGANRALPFAPPADGPLVPVGTRAGEIGISARASAGQLVIDLSTPQVGDTASPSYALGLTLADPRGTTRPVKLRGCGTGCFYTPVAWHDGTSHLTLTASAGPWQGGRAGLAVDWPPQPDAALLREAVAAMKAVPHFTLHELVTSNTASGLGNPMALPVSGNDFLASEPYGSGTAPVTTRLPDEGGRRLIALAYPAEHLQLALTLERDGRILHETLAAPNHLITRTFVYPEGAEER
ncbi:CopD family protein [Streptomyces sp. H10-C2]|uniref:copper resistance CopC/CopD family protein n=1 Tax=unclassified Streptomyces TaxID=2593676 RepID=UPI0024BAB5F2|nr:MULTISPECIES: CopD family protein [unclassified Streptomyces]MDJ0341040.1 CopD family protein [Streptomyces sp. PH10-H1]MDJ0369728.1 CopD family protein [Streptomyces sp. H10-C2]